MSYEGFTQYLCSVGHYWEVDAMAVRCDADKGEITVCPYCEGPPVWENDVDVTNGSHDESGKRIDGYVEVVSATGVEPCKCPTCGAVHFPEPETYVVPKTKVSL